MSGNRLILIGLDSFDPHIARTWMDEGLLPALASLQDTSTRCDIRYPPGVESGTVWPSFFRGKDPSHHGQYDGTRFFNAETYELDTWSRDALEDQALWHVLSRAGKRSIFIDAPYMPLPDHHNGLFLVDWCAHFSVHGAGDLEPASLPPEFAAEVVARYGGDTLEGRSCDNINPTTAEEQAWFRDALVERVGRKLALTKDLIRDEQWDLLAVFFCDAHCAIHQSLHLCWQDHPDYDADMAAEVGDPVKDTFLALDRAVGEIIEAAPAGAQIMVHMSHGADLPYTGTGLLDRILQRLEGKNEPKVDSVGRRLRAIWRDLPPPLKALLGGLRRILAPRLRRDFSRRDRVGRRYFEVPVHAKTGGIRLNLKGREAEGQVDPDDYASVCAEIVDALQSFENEETGEPLVEDIRMTRDLYDGPRRDVLPDILVTWNRRQPIHSVSSPLLGRFNQVTPTARTGDHHFEGAFMSQQISGKGVRLNDAVSVTDLAPTIAAGLGAATREMTGSAQKALGIGRADPEPL